MSLWETIKKGMEEGASAVSEKAAEWLKTGSASFKEGSEMASEKIAYGTKLAKLKYEYRAIQKAIEKEFTELGGIVFHVLNEKTGADLKKETRDSISKISSLEEELKIKEKEIEELPKSFNNNSIDRKNVDQLKKNLETGGGTIEQVVIEKKSPFLGKKLKEITLPDDALVGTIIRNDDVIIPDGDTIFQLDDKVTLLGKREDVEKTISQIIPE
jgi:K+/H+ antiporter YhaU regulatory subunit KhtT